MNIVTNMLTVMNLTNTPLQGTVTIHPLQTIHVVNNYTHFRISVHYSLAYLHVPKMCTNSAIVSRSYTYMQCKQLHNFKSQLIM